MTKTTDPKPPSTEHADAAGPRFSRRIHITDPDAAFAEIQAENDSLMDHIAALEARLLSTEEVAYIRNRKAADDNAAWLWKTIKTHAPWISILGGMAGSALYWIVTHSITIKGNP